MVEEQRRFAIWGGADRARATRGVRSGGVALLLVAAVVLLGCSRFGEATIRIDEAEEEIATLAEEIVEVIALDVTSSTPLGSRTRCQLVTGAEGAANRLSARGPIPDTPDPLGRAAAVLTEAGYTLVPGEDDEVFGRRDGLRITVAIDASVDEVAIDANTDCRPLGR